MSASEKRWTIHDIAEKAGVSVKTVSFVINGKKGVKDETREHVLRIIKEAGFRPHIGARALRSTLPHSIGVTLPAPPDTVPVSQGFFIWLYEELYHVFGARGFYLNFDMNPYAAGPGSDYARGVWERAFGACVLAGPLASNDQTVIRLHRAGVPYVALGRLDAVPEVSCATVDYEEGTRLSVRFLVQRGHRRIGMLKAFTGFQPGVERRRGYCRAIAEAGLPLDENLIRSVTFGAHSTASMVHRILDNRDITALVDCSATEDGAAIREGARRAGRVPGKDFEVVSWTYTSGASVLNEAVAHVWLPVREAAAEGFEQLSAWVDGRVDGPIHVVYTPVLYESATRGEVEKPRRLFAYLD